MRVPIPTGIRDRDFDGEAYQRLLSVELAARGRLGGPSPAQLIAIATLNLHLGNLAEARKWAEQLAVTHPDEAAAIIEAAARIERGDPNGDEE